MLYWVLACQQEVTTNTFNLTRLDYLLWTSTGPALIDLGMFAASTNSAQSTLGLSSYEANPS